MAPEAEQGIRASTEQLLESVPDGVVIVDHEGVIRFVNRQAATIFDYEQVELIGRPVEVLVPIRMAALHSARRLGYFESPTTRPMGARSEPCGQRKDGSEFPVGISLSSLETDDGVLVLAAVRDITRSKKMEVERTELEARLRQVEVDEGRASLEAQLHQAQRLESIGQLAGGVAHDFNNLLAGIMNYASLVSDGLEVLLSDATVAHRDVLAAEVASDVEEIKNVARRAADLTHQLLIFSRREVMKLEVLDLNSLVDGMEELLRRTFGADIDLQIRLADDLPRIKVDRGQIEQVLMNLVVNARDAMPGGGKLVIETSEFCVDVSFARIHSLGLGRHVRLSVTDTGMGMTAAVVDRALEPFFTTKPKGVGSGLGLATVYGIVTQARGDVAIHSEPGRGTTVQVNLPITEEKVTVRVEVLPGDPPPSSGETILLVEDEAIVRDPARRILQRSGYVVLAAADSDEALVHLAESGPIDLLLTDVVMPRRSGRELAAEVAEVSPETKVIFMSGYSQDVFAHQGVLEEGVHLIEKPFEAKLLLRTVRDVLDGPA